MGTSLLAHPLLLVFMAVTCLPWFGAVGVLCVIGGGDRVELTVGGDADGEVVSFSHGFGYDVTRCTKPVEFGAEFLEALAGLFARVAVRIFPDEFVMVRAGSLRSVAEVSVQAAKPSACGTETAEVLRHCTQIPSRRGVLQHSRQPLVRQRVRSHPSSREHVPHPVAP